MKRRQIYFAGLILILVLIIFGVSAGMLFVNMEEEPNRVSVIVNDSNNDRWIAMRQGLEQAANEENIQLNYVSTGVLTSEEEQKALIDREVENGAQGVIVQLVSSVDPEQIFGQMDGSVAIMLLESDVDPEGVYALTAPDNRKIGTALAEAVIADQDGSLSGVKIGVLSGSSTLLSMQQRLSGVKDTLEDAGAELVWCIYDSTESFSTELAAMQEDSPVDIILSLGNRETETAVDYLQAGQEEEQPFRLYGEGCSEKAVYYLDKGVITALVVPNEFNMGYQSMRSIAKQLQYKLSSADSEQVDSLVVKKENLYDEENQKILFPIVQ